MINKLGLNGLSKLNPSKPQTGGGGGGGNFIVGRVLDIILNEDHPLFNEYGQYNSIGIIELELIVGGNNGTRRIVKPLFPNIKSYPLVNELVTCFPLPIPTLDNSRLDIQYYYLNSINTWNHPHHNALPTPTTNNIPQNQIQDYQQSGGGTVRRVTDNSTEINLGSPTNPTQNTFIEESNIHPLIPFEGDIIYEGRFGNSLRFGSTSKTSTKIKNNWSSGGNNGSPITILRNGQPNKSNNEGWIPITEDINNDLSSIYLTSTQKIPFVLSNENFLSYSNPPIIPSQYNQPQNIFNSSRIILNAYSDSVLISGNTSVGISSNESVNIESKQIYFDGIDIKLGSKDATQPVLKGNDSVELLKQLVTEIRNISKVLETSQIFPKGVPTPDVQTQTVAQLATKNLNNILSILNDDVKGIKSNFVKVK